LNGTHYLGALPEVVGEGRTLTVGLEAHVSIGGGFTRLTSVNPTPQSVSRPTWRTKHFDFWIRRPMSPIAAIMTVTNSGVTICLMRQIKAYTN
jgi:hypothetical protein